MHADCREEARMLIGQLDGCVQMRRAFARADGEHSGHARGKCAGDHCFAIFIELIAVDV